MSRPVLRVAVRRFGPFESAIRKQFEDFRAIAGVDADIEPVGMDLEDLSRTMFDAGGLRDGSWDIGFVVTDWLPMAVGDGHLADLSARASELPAEGAPDCWPACLRGRQEVGGGLWGLPYHDGPQCLIYRPDVFAAACARFADSRGRVLSPPQTWDEFVDVARFFTDPAANRWGAVVASYPDAHNTVYDFCAQIWSRGGSLTDADGRPDLASAEAVAGLSFYRWLVRESGVVHPAALETDSVMSGAIFARGEAVMMTNWFGFAGHAVASADPPVRGNVGVAPMPYGPGAGPASVLVYWVLAVGSGSRHQDLAWRFIRHATSAPMVGFDGKAAFERRDEAKQMIAERLATRTTAHWLALFEPADLWCAEVLDWPALLSGGAVGMLDMLQAVSSRGGQEIQTTRLPLRIDGARPVTSTAAPDIGQDTDAILRGLIAVR